MSSVTLKAGEFNALMGDPSQWIDGRHAIYIEEMNVIIGGEEFDYLDVHFDELDPYTEITINYGYLNSESFETSKPIVPQIRLWLSGDRAKQAEGSADMPNQPVAPATVLVSIRAGDQARFEKLMRDANIGYTIAST